MTEMSKPEVKSSSLPGPGAKAGQPHPPSPLIIGRRLWLTVHKYIGLTLGALFVLVGLTGSILAFWQAIANHLHSKSTLNTQSMIKLTHVG